MCTYIYMRNTNSSQSENAHEKHQFKMVTLSEAINEYNVIIKTVAPILKKLPFYNRKMFIFDVVLNKLNDVTDNHNLDTKSKSNSYNVNKQSSIVMILQFKDGCGIDVEQCMKKSMDVKNFNDLNLKLIDLLKYGITAINDQHLYHMNIKANNIVVDCDSNIVKLANWDKSIKLNPGDFFPHDYSCDIKPLPYNMPFVSILMGSCIREKLNICSVDYAEWTDFLHIIQENDKHMVPIIMNIYEFTKMQAKKHLMQYFLSMMKLIKQRKGSTIFMHDAYIQNIDIWGFIMVYYTFLGKVNDTIDVNIRHIFKKYIYDVKYAFDPIPTDELSNDLQKIHLKNSEIEPDNNFETLNNKPIKFAIKTQKLSRCPNGFCRSKIDKKRHGSMQK